MKKKILLVDDEQIFHFINIKIIERAGIDCNIKTALNGREALSTIHDDLKNRLGAPDMIFVDLNMPVMDGFEFIHTFQQMQIPNKEAVTIVILTSSMRDADIDKAASMGVKHFVTKPLTDDDISNIINSSQHGG